MDLTVVAYVIYLLVSVALTIWVARTLSQNGRIFLADVLHGNEKLADAVNHLLVVGFYLVNLGFVALYLSQDEEIADARGVFEALSTKIGVVLLVLGAMHLGNVYVLNKIRRRGIMEREQQPPVPPQDWVAPAVGGVTAMATAATPDRDAARVPVRGLTVLYDAQCSLCGFLRDWLVRQRQLVPLELVPAGSEAAMRRFPGLDHAATLDEITVIGDSGQVYRGTAAWIVTLWALAEHRPTAHRFSTPAGARLARGAVLAAAKWREGQWARRHGAWGGGAYYGANGWQYSPATGWTYNAPACDSDTCAPR